MLQVLVKVMQPWTNHFATDVTERRKDKRPCNRAKNIERQENFRRQMAGTYQYRADNSKAVHKACANDEQIGMTLDQSLGAANFLAMFRKIIVLIPLIYILPMFIEDKVMAVFLAEPIADVIAVVTTLLLFRKNFKKVLSEMKQKSETQDV